MQVPHSIRRSSPRTSDRGIVSIRRELPPKATPSPLAIGLTVLLMFGPLAFGAVEPWAILTLQAGAAILAFAWMLQQLRRGVIGIRWNPLFAPLLLFSALVAGELLFRTTVYPYVTRANALLLVTYALLMFLAAQCLHGTPTIRPFAVSLAVFGSAVAMFAIVQQLTFNGKVYWLRQARFGGPIFGPYVNHNHYAGLMEMLTPIPLVFALDDSLGTGKRLLALFAGILMGSSVVLSLSRGGMIALAAEMVFLIVVIARARRSKSVLSLGLAVFVLLSAFVIYAGTTAVWSRLDTFRAMGSEPDVALRLVITKDTLHMFAGRPLAGWGLGTFTTVYPQYQSFYYVKVINAAHNDVAQMLAETGLLGFAALFWFVIVLYQYGLRNLRRQNPDELRLGVLAACTGLLVHSFVDFNFQIPANAALFGVLAIVATSGPESEDVVMAEHFEVDRDLSYRDPETRGPAIVSGGSDVINCDTCARKRV